jgi:hypothetical protein
MDKQKQRIKIAEACGWDWYGLPGELEKDKRPNGPWFGPSNDAEQLYVDGIPDYLNDLNAMHEAEKTLDDRQRLRYMSRLTEATSHMTYHLATATQRAEAFLRTLNLWEE